MRRLWFISSIILFSVCVLSASAKNLGSIGDVWTIQEQSLLSVIYEQLNEQFSGKSEEEIKQEVQKRITENVLRPPANYLNRASKNSERLFDPSFTLDRDIADHKGQVFARKGQVFSPFDVAPFNRTLIFIDADDVQQIKWLKAFKPETDIFKIILVKGNIRDAAEQLDREVYFDQQGSLVKRFGIKAVPSVIDEAEEKKMLRIREFAIQ